MSGWTKLFSSIVTSSVWCEDHATVRVWVAMLATADADGVVDGSLPGFANLARVTVDEMRAAVETLSASDPNSRTPDHEGRRIESIQGGWRILNYLRYREKGQAKEGSRAPYYRARRAQQRAEAAQPSDVARNTEERRERREAETDNPPTPPEGGVSVGRPAPAPGRASRGRSRRTIAVSPEVRDVIGFYNRITGRDVKAETHADVVQPRLQDGIPVTTLKLAVIGACLSPHHIGLNDDKAVYLDPETIFRRGRVDGHAERARFATFRLERGDEIWSFWSERLKLKGAVMEHFFRARDQLLIEEGREPIGPSAVYASGYRQGDPWPASAEVA